MNTNNKILKIDNLSNMSFDSILEAYRNGYSIESIGKIENLTSSNIVKLSKVCPSGNTIVQGTSKTIQIKWSGGTPGATIKAELLVDGNSYATSNTTGTSFSVPYVFNDSPGSHTYSARVTDNCSGRVAIVETCTVTITDAPPVLYAITFSPSSVSIAVGESWSVIASCTDTLYHLMKCPSLTWSKNNNNITYIVLPSGGVTVTGVTAGTPTVVTASAGGISASFTVTVTAAQCPTLNVTFNMA